MQCISPEALDALAASPLFERLTALHLAWQPERYRGALARALAPAAERSRLRQLELHSIFLSGADLAALARSGALRAVTTLDLSGNYHLDATGIRALAE